MEAVQIRSVRPKQQSVASRLGKTLVTTAKINEIVEHIKNLA